MNNEQVAQKRKILIVEDDNFVSEIYSTKLLEMGYQVLIAQNGHEGLKLAEEKKPDLILLDVIMPVMGGIKMLEELRKKEEIKNVPVILLTNVGDQESIQEAKKLGVKEYLIKSHFTPAEIVEKVTQFLGNKKNGKQNSNRNKIQ